MVDKIPWDTCVISLIFGVFKMDFQESTVMCFKMRCFLPLPPPPLPNTTMKLWRNSVYLCPTLYGGGGGGVEQV